MNNQEEKYIDVCDMPTTRSGKVIDMVKRNGLSSISKLSKSFSDMLYFTFKRPALFSYKGKKLKLFYHWYNATWNGERQVEVPIICSYLANYSGHVLELGNVLANYVSFPHAILDKYDPSKGIIHDDALTFKAKKPFGMIVSISTLEHIGRDEVPQNPEKVVKAIKNLTQSLAEGGKFVFTVPMGYNSALDAFVLSKKMPNLSTCFLHFNGKVWHEISPTPSTKFIYGEFHKGDRAICVGVIEKK